MLNIKPKSLSWYNYRQNRRMQLVIRKYPLKTDKTRVRVAATWEDESSTDVINDGQIRFTVNTW